ncbi:hypothetical protein PHLGIDRAFT_76821, partial [Phlebiopsis gigantea 11061_1 CR5-6]
RGDHPPTPGKVVAIKSASILPEFSKQPHDIVRETQILSTLGHTNVRSFTIYEEDTSTVHFWMPFIPHSVYDLLRCPSFAPNHSPASSPSPARGKFAVLARSLIYQIASAISYLHDVTRGVAHRDIKPRNILLTPEGCIKLIDFGISWQKPVSSLPNNLWPEPPNELCPHICTGPYRAPETIFGPTNYDPFAVDLWSLGALCAEFFTSLRLIPDDDSDDESGNNLDSECPKPFIFPKNYELTGMRGSWARESLFDADRGSIGLAWSIFKIRGTPDETTWPSFGSLPDAGKVSFIDAKPVALYKLLPNLPPLSDGQSYPADGTHFPPEQPCASSLDFIQRLLVYPPERRMRAVYALRHPWLTEQPLLLPQECRSDDNMVSYNGETLGEMIHSYLAAGPL